MLRPLPRLPFAALLALAGMTDAKKTADDVLKVGGGAVRSPLDALTVA